MVWGISPGVPSKYSYRRPRRRPRRHRRLLGTTFPLPFIALPFRRFLTFTACGILMIPHFPRYTAVLTITFFSLLCASFFFCFSICAPLPLTFVLLLSSYCYVCASLLYFFSWRGKQAKEAEIQCFLHEREQSALSACGSLWRASRKTVPRLRGIYPHLYLPLRGAWSSVRVFRKD